MSSANLVYTIRSRRRIEVNTDPQLRCYNGVHAKSEMRWTAWEPLEIGVSADKIERRLTFWQELNDYAISQRGESAKCEFEAVRVDQNEQLLQQVADESRYQ